MFAIELFGSVTLFYASLLALIVLLSISEVCESGFFATIIAGMFLASVELYSNADPLRWSVAHWPVMIALVIGYLCIGLLWGRFKWIQLCREQYQKFPFTHDKPLRIANHKAWFIQKASCWPVGVFVFLTFDLFKNVWNVVYEFSARTLQADSDRLFREIRKTS